MPKKVRPQLTEVITGDSIAEYTYAPDGLRQSKTVNGKYTRFVYENGSVSAEITEGNTYNYYRGTELMGYTSHTGDLYYYISDSHGNIVSVTDVLGVNKKDYSYDAYGNQKAFSVNPQGDMSVVYQWQSENENIYNPFRYCGEYTDEETGFVYLRNRYYDSTVGRFITEDPYWNINNMIYGDEEDKNTKKKEIKIPDVESIMQSSNLYAYCMNNPMMYVDPSGEAIETILDLISIGMSMQDLINNPSWMNFGFLAWDVASTILPAIPGSYVYDSVKVLNGVSDLGKLTKHNFRKNLTNLIGDAPSWMKKAEAHHVLPQKFEDWFMEKGLNIHDPRFGSWVDAESHRKWSKSYNDYWKDYKKRFPNASDEEIVNYARKLADIFGFEVNY